VRVFGGDAKAFGPFSGAGRLQDHLKQPLFLGNGYNFTDGLIEWNTETDCIGSREDCNISYMCLITPGNDTLKMHLK